MQIVIIGNGISGATAARWCRKLGNDSITIISSEYPTFFSRTALMYVYMGHMKMEDIIPYPSTFWTQNNIHRLQEHVNHIDFDDQKLSFLSGRSISYDKLILALGSKPNKIGWPGQDLDGVQGLYHYQDLQNMEAFTKNIDHAVIVGGGLIGVEMAEMMLSRQISVTFLVREKSFWDFILPKEESSMITAHIHEHMVDLRLSTELREITSDPHGRCQSVITHSGEVIPCQFVGLTIGVQPNIDFIKSSPLLTDKGILVNDKLRTNIPNVYAIGDCAQLRQPHSKRKPIEPIWYTGRMMGEVVAHNIYDNSIEYDPGIWFNSAKFFDIEYQIYGFVPNTLPHDHDSLFWQSDDLKHSVRIVFEKKTTHVVGFNLLGVRFRHEVCEKWITDKTPLKSVIAHLSLANFDPEFFPDYSTELVIEYEKKTGEHVTVRPSKGWNNVFQFLANKTKR